MEHSFLDKYADKNKFIQGLDPRVKIISSLALMILIISTPLKSYYNYLLYVFIIIFLALLSGVPVSFLLKKSLYFIPFTFFLVLFSLISPASTFGGNSAKVILIANIVAKSWLTFLITILLICVTGFESFLKGLEKLKVPKLIILLFSFIYRYFFVFLDEFMRMVRSARCRSVKFHAVRFLGSIIGTLFVRTYERAERIYQAMTARGFEGEIHTYNELILTNKDKGFLYLSLGMMVIICLATF